MSARFALLALPLFLVGCPKADGDEDDDPTPPGPQDGGTETDGGAETDGGGTDGGGDGGGTGALDLTPDPSSELAKIQQYDGYAENDSVTVSGVVTSPDTGSGFFMADAEGPWAAVWVYHGGNAAVAQGDAVTVSATLIEFNDITELNASKGSVTVDGAGIIPDPVLVTTAELTDGEIAEALEAVLIQVEDVTVASDNADGPDNDYGEFLIDDGVRVDDLFYDADPSTGDTYSVLKGLWNYTYGQYKLEPRDGTDLR